MSRRRYVYSVAYETTCWAKLFVLIVVGNAVLELLLALGRSWDVSYVERLTWLHPVATAMWIVSAPIGYLLRPEVKEKLSQWRSSK